ncbi:hypothetical protein C8R45DRAFT_978028 [Mycena sanguinolenta]|nr:hypothetical protein C8R45DRAFT_978028 [Mycena sanguinolenta]
MASQNSEQSVTHCLRCNKTHSLCTPLTQPPFQSLVDQKPIPTAAEAAVIRDFVLETNAEIAWRELLVNRLSCELAELRRRSERYKPLLSPIRRVPPEIMAEIFLQLTAIEAQSHHPSDNYKDKKILPKVYMVGPFLHRAPLIFGEISRRWRAIALSTPSLWNCVSLKCTRDGEALQNNIFLCNSWLKRSGSLPLSIRFYGPDGYTVDSQKFINQCQDLFGILLPYAERWRLLDLKDFPAPCYQVFRGLPSNSVPRLETLSISHTESANFALWTRLSMPKLLFLYFDSIGGDSILFREKGSTSPWSRLTHIDVGDCSAYDCLQILGAALTAVACRFVVNRTSFSQHPPVFHTRLQTLRFEVCDDVVPTWTLLTCSGLSTLSIVVKARGTKSYFQHLPSFITRSGATIQLFEMEGSGLDDTQFLSCLADMPRLRTLVVVEDVYGSPPQFTNHVWKSLTWPKDSDSFLPLIPDLDSLILDGSFRFSYDSMTRMLESRVGTAANPADDSPKLRAVTFVVWRNMRDLICQKLLNFRTSGLEVFLYFHTTGSETSDSGSESCSESDSEEE